MEFTAFVDALFARGKELGFTDMEVYQQTGSDFAIRIFQQEVDDYSVSTSGGLGFRGRFAGKFGYAYTEKLDPSLIEWLLTSAKNNALVVEAEDEVELFAGSEEYPQVEMSSGRDIDPQAKIRFAKELESLALQMDSRVQGVNYCLYQDQAQSVRIRNTEGLDLTCDSSIAFAYLSVVVKEGEETKTASRFQVAPDLAGLNHRRLAEEAVAEAISFLGAKTLPSNQYPVILRADAAVDLLATFAGVFSAENAQRGLSLLGERIGEGVAADVVTLVDDPHLPQGGSSAPFDAEGVATEQTTVIDSGVLTTLLHNLKTAAKDGVRSTGNGAKASYKGVVTVAPSNLYIQRGTLDLAGLMETMQDGLVITDLQGLHSGANPVSGDFSLAARGYLVQSGQITRPVEQITVAGNWFSLLKDIRAVGADLEFGLPSSLGTYGAPSLLIEGLTVSGE